MKNVFFACLALLVLITGCAKDHHKPEPVTDYPESVYFKAEGTGQSEAEARDQSLAEMSRIFEAEVFSDMNDRVVEIVDSEGGGISRSNIESNVRVVSSVKLEGARIARTWFDNEKGLYRSLAVLDRRQAGDNWQGKIKEIDSKIEVEYIFLDSDSSKFMKLRSLMRILDHWVEREVFVSRLRVIGLQDTSRRTYDMKRVFHMITQIRADTLVFLKITGKYGPEVESKLSEAIVKAGFVQSEERNRADVIITGNVEAGPVELKNPGWEFARAQISLSIIDTVTGSTVGEISENARAGHLTYSEAVHKAVKKISIMASEKLIEYFK